VVKEFDKNVIISQFFFLTDANNLNVEKLVELEATEKLKHIDVIAVPEVQAKNPDLLKMDGF
jgi:hypothetical protein